MKHTLIVFLSLMTNVCFGQNLFQEKFMECKPAMLYVENDSFLVDYQPQDSLFADIINKIDLKIQEKILGDLTIQVLVDTLGKSCCMSLLNNTNISTRKLKIPEIISKLENWKVIANPVRAQTISIQLKLTFTPEKIRFERIGFKYKKKPIYVPLVTQEMTRK